MADELAEQHLPAGDRVAQQQQHGAAFDLADDGVVRDQQGDQRQQEDRQAGQADDHDVERPTPTVPVGALPRKVSVRASAAISRVVASTQRLRSPPGSPCRDDQDVAHRAASWPQEMGVELVKRRRRSSISSTGAPRPAARRSTSILSLGRGIDLDHMAVDPCASVDGPSQFGTFASPASGDLQADADRQAGDAAQLVERAVGDLDPAVHDDDAFGLLLQLGQGVGGQQHRRAARRAAPRRSRRSSWRRAGSRPVVGSSRSSTRGSPSSAWASPSRWRMPLE